MLSLSDYLMEGLGKGSSPEYWALVKQQKDGQWARRENFLVTTGEKMGCYLDIERGFDTYGEPWEGKTPIIVVGDHEKQVCIGIMANYRDYDIVFWYDGHVFRGLDDLEKRYPDVKFKPQQIPRAWRDQDLEDVIKKAEKLVNKLN